MDLKKRKQNKKILKELSGILDGKINSTSKSSSKRIIFCPMNATTMNTVKESIFAKGCEFQGAEISFLYLDERLPFIEFYNTTTEWLIFKKKVSENKKYCRKINIDTIGTSQYQVEQPKLAEFDIKNIEKLSYKNILIGDLCVSSAVRKLLCHGPEWNNPEFVAIVKNCIVTAQVLIDKYTLLLDEYKPDKLVMSHGIYLSWGTLFRLARSKNIPVDVYGSSYRKNTLRFYHNSPNAPFPLGEWDKYSNTELSANEQKILDDYFLTRENQSEDNFKLFDENAEIPERLRVFVEQSKSENKKIACLFTNISWDAYAFSSEGKFESMLDWLESTIEWARTRDDFSLIIKAHPVEKLTTPEKYRVRTFLNGIKIPENIFFIDENMSVKPFWIYQKIDFGLIHISTVSVEMALKNIPVLGSGADGHYNNKGFTLDPKNKEDYFNQLEKLVSGKSEFKPDLEQAKRYMFFRFFREAIKIDSISISDLSTIEKVNFTKIEDLKTGNNKNLDVVVNGIMNDKEFILEYE